MAKQYLIYATEGGFNNLNASLNTYFGYPTGNTASYAEPIIHPIDGRFAIVITPEAKADLSPSQKSNLVDELSDDWFLTFNPE